MQLNAEPLKTINLNLFYTFLFLLLAVTSIAQPSVLATGKWFKVSVTSDGIYQIDYTLLKKMGIDPTKINPTTLKVFSYPTGMLPQANNAPRQKDLRELAILVTGEGDGKFNTTDRIIFYGQGPDGHTFKPSSKTFWYENNLYTDKNYYFITYDGAAGKRVTDLPNAGGNNPTSNTFYDFIQFEEDLTNILNSGREWFGFSFRSTTEATAEFTLVGLAENSELTLISNVMARTFEPTTFSLFYNGTAVGQQTINSVPDSQYGLKGRMKRDTMRFSVASVNGTAATHRLKYQFAKTNNSAGYLDNFLVSGQRVNKLYGASTIGTLYNPNGLSNVEIQTSTDLTVWDVSDPFDVRNQLHTSNGTSVTFSANIGIPKRLGWFSDGALLAKPEIEGVVTNQNIQAIANVNMLIVAHPTLLTEAQRLAAHRNTFSNITTAIVTPQQIYNEYSGGRQDVSAIRDFIRAIYTQSNTLKYVLLLGRASYDYKDQVVGNTNLVPIYSSRNSLAPLETYCSDDFYGFMESHEGEWSETNSFNHTLDLGVGRIPARNADDAKHYVDKLIEYDTNPLARGQWRSTIAFTADDGDGNLHQRDANQLANYVETIEPSLHARKIYLDSYTQIQKSFGQISPETSQHLNRVFHEGALIINFTGHGSELLWMQERILDQIFVGKLKNRYRYPFLITATCEFGRAEDPGIISSAEKILFREDAGAIGLLTSSRPVNAFTNYQLNLDFYEAFLTDEPSKNQPIGTIFRAAKNKGSLGVANRNFALLGDPAMHIGLTPSNIEITKLENADAETDLEGNTTYFLEGRVTQAGNTRTDFSGEVEIKIYQPASTKITKGDENAPFQFSEFDKLLYQGKATVTQGEFATSVITPTLTNTNPLIGRLITYAVTSDAAQQEARGSRLVNISTINNPLTDVEPPSVSLFMNDTTFLDGGIANENPFLIALLKDNVGIDISGSEEQAITATLDNDTIFNVTNYFQTDANRANQGRLAFQVFGLSEGKHQISLTAFDVAGNQTTGIVNFKVGEANELTASTVFGWPNPFQDQVKIGFLHNRSGEDLSGQLIICNAFGQPVTSFQFETPNSLFNQQILEWDGTMENGAKLPAGLYILRLIVRSEQDGSKSEAFGKVVLTN